MTPAQRLFFGYACDGLVRCVHTAANRAIPDYVPYYGHVVSRSVWQARHVVREARKLGLYPSTEQLAREAA